jgi:hypothetical protein
VRVHFSCHSADEGKRLRTHKIAAWILGALIIAYCYAFINAITTASENSYQCKALESAAITGHPIPTSVSQPGKSAAFCELGVHFPLLRTYFTVFIYGVLDPTQQDAIVASLRNAPRGPNAKKILVQFFDKENWRPWSDPASGRSGGSRGPETPIATRWTP